MKLPFLIQIAAIATFALATPAIADTPRAEKLGIKANFQKKDACVEKILRVKSKATAIFALVGPVPGKVEAIEDKVEEYCEQLFNGPIIQLDGGGVSVILLGVFVLENANQCEQNAEALMADGITTGLPLPPENAPNGFPIAVAAMPYCSLFFPDPTPIFPGPLGGCQKNPFTGRVVCWE